VKDTKKIWRRKLPAGAAFFSPAGVWQGMDYSARMELFNKILKIAVEGGASDIHIKIGTPVIFRINRELIAIECPLPTQPWMNKVSETASRRRI
jgi:type II secretory ATPase GspE/PulE/Tfp pilus assembly ATPase PilB-like protein